MHVGRSNNKTTYFIDNHPVSATSLHNDLGVSFQSDLGFASHIEKVIQSANRASWFIRSSFKGCDAPTLMFAFTTYVRPILEYNSPLWSPSYLTYIDSIERVARSFTKRLPGLYHLSYQSRLAILKQHSLEWRRIFCDLRLFYSIYHDRCHLPSSCAPLFSHLSTITRGHSKRIRRPPARSNIRLFSFTVRIAPIWNSLPPHIVDSPSVTIFCSRLKNFDIGCFCKRFPFRPPLFYQC